MTQEELLKQQEEKEAKLTAELDRLRDKYGNAFDESAVLHKMIDGNLTSPSQAFKELTGKLDLEDSVRSRLYDHSERDKPAHITRDNLRDSVKSALYESSAESEPFEPEEVRPTSETLEEMMQAALSESSKEAKDE